MSPLVGVKSSGMSVLEQGVNLKLRTRLAIANLASKRANLIPTQFRGPPPNGM